MRASALFFTAALFAVAAAGLSRAQEEGPLTLSSPTGAAISFTAADGRWRWTALRTPEAPAEGWRVTDEATEIGLGEQTTGVAAEWNLVEAAPDKIVFEQEIADGALRLRRVYSFGAAPNTLRIETFAQATGGKRQINRISLLYAQFAGAAFREMGAPPVSFPVFADTLFAGIEHVSGEASVLGEEADWVLLQHRPRVTIGEEWQALPTVVVGWTEPGVGNGVPGEARIREAFLRYLDTVRLKPDRIVVHGDSWWTVPQPLNEKNLLAEIDSLRRVFADRTGMFFDTFCVDLGWSDPRTFWGMNTKSFPNELRTVNDRLAAAGTKMGLWASPGSGYPEALNNGWLQSQGYELMPFIESLPQAACMALGTRYQREFKDRMVGYVRQYGLGHVILDFMPQRCDVATHGHPVGPESRYAIDAGLADVIDSLRAANPALVLEPMVCGYPPSPWWLMKTPFVLGPVGDDMPYGRGPCPDWLESLITARDIAYRAGQEAWIMPTQALETFDIIVLTPGEFQNTAVMAVGRGRWFLSTYFKTDMMKPEDWDFFAALVRWTRQNKQYLENAWQIGGRPEDREAYGFMFRNASKDLYCVRNPWIELPVSGTLQESRDVRMIYPRRATVGRIEPGGGPLRLTLAPYETAFLETAPVTEDPLATADNVSPVEVTAAAPRVVGSGSDAASIQYSWEGVIAAADAPGAELCVLVEGARDVERVVGRIRFDGQEMKPKKVTSAGQFGAAIDASPENWTWFILPLPAGNTAFQIDLGIPLDKARVAVFVRGTTPAANAPAPDDGGAVFPTFHADRRTWTQTLQPVTEFAARAP